jgi:hypothetical protein
MRDLKAKKRKNSGQSLLEYMLILLMVSTISYGFLDTADERLAKIWVKMIRIVSGDNRATLENLR